MRGRGDAGLLLLVLGHACSCLLKPGLLPCGKPNLPDLFQGCLHGVLCCTGCTALPSCVLQRALPVVLPGAPTPARCTNAYPWSSCCCAGNGNLVDAFGDSTATRFLESFRGILRGNVEQAAKLWQEARAIREGLVKGNAEAGIAAITAESALVKEFLTARIDNYDEAMKVG